MLYFVLGILLLLSVGGNYLCYLHATKNQAVVKNYRGGPGQISKMTNVLMASQAYVVIYSGLDIYLFVVYLLYNKTNLPSKNNICSHLKLETNSAF